MAAVKVRQAGLLSREIKRIRDQQGFATEFKFNRITQGKFVTFTRIIDALEAADTHIGACVVDRNLPGCDPFTHDEAEWQTHARITAKLLAGIINKRELCTALIDQRSTPAGIAFDDTVQAMTNHRLRATGLVGAVCVDSCTNEGVQLADLVAGAVALQRRAQFGSVNPASPKAKIAARLAGAFGVSDFSGDIRTERVNVLTHGRTIGTSRVRKNSVKATG